MVLLFSAADAYSQFTVNADGSAQFNVGSYLPGFTGTAGDSLFSSRRCPVGVRLHFRHAGQDTEKDGCSGRRADADCQGFGTERGNVSLYTDRRR